MDQLVIRRFAELAKQAAAILEAKTVHNPRQLRTGGYAGTPYTTVDKPSGLQWGTSVTNLLQRVFREDSVHYKMFQKQFLSCTYFDHAFLECIAIFNAAKEDYEGGYLFSMRSLIQAEAFNDELEQAEALLKAGYKDPACVVAGVVLETTLKELCNRNALPIAKLDKMNADLCKAGAYNMGMQKQITAWAERRNKAAHGDWTEYTAADVEDMLKGVNRVVAELL